MKKQESILLKVEVILMLIFRAILVFEPILTEVSKIIYGRNISDFQSAHPSGF
jgi:hypothetical protein